MRMPRNPKPFDELVSSYEPNNLVRLLGSDIGSLPKDRYLHWDQLRHLPPPEGFTSLDWWTAVKFKRMVSRHELPFKDSRGRPFSFSDTGNLYPSAPSGGSGCERANRGPPRRRGQQRLPRTVYDEFSDRRGDHVKPARGCRHDPPSCQGDAEIRPTATRQQRTDDRQQTTLGMEFLRENVGEELTVSMLMDLQRTLTEGTLDPRCGRAAPAAGRRGRCGGPARRRGRAHAPGRQVSSATASNSSWISPMETHRGRSIPASGRQGHPTPLHGQLRPSVCRWKWTDRTSTVLLVYGEIGVLADRVPLHFGGHSESTRSVRSRIRVLRNRRQRRHVFPRLQPAGDLRLDPPLARVLGAQDQRDE